MNQTRKPGGFRYVAEVLTLCCALFACASARAQVKVGDAFPKVPGMDGKVTFVDFWASWCAPCKASFPAYARIYSDYNPKGLVVLAVSVDESPAAYAAFLRRSAPPFPTTLDENHKLVSVVKVPTMPTSYLIGRDGRVRFIHVGYHSGETEKTLRHEIDALLAEKS